MSKKIIRLPKTLTIFSLAMINVAAIGSVKNWPFIAEYGFASIFFLILAAVVFFFPVSLVSAELATGWPEQGGIYVWIREAFGHRTGFLAIWLLWIENVAWYPTILSFIAATLAYAIDPTLSENTSYNVILVISLFWIATFLNLFGMRLSSLLSTIGAICGTFIPAAVIITLGGVWYFSGTPLATAVNAKALLPDFSSWNQIVFFTGVLLALSGMEMSSIHARDVKDPQRDYPRAILLSALLILILSILGVLSIAFVIPKEQISLVGGSIQAISIFFNYHHLNSLTSWISFIICIGAFGSICTWVIGPSKGLLAAARGGDLPASLTKVNHEGVPTRLLILQLSIVTILSLFFLLMPSVSSGFWLLTVLVAQLYLIMYILLFAAAIRLRYSHPHIQRAYSVPGGNVGIWITSVIGILACLFALIIGFFPPSQVAISSTFYATFLIVGIVIGCIAPWIYSRLKAK